MCNTKTKRLFLNKRKNSLIFKNRNHNLKAIMNVLLTRLKNTYHTYNQEHLIKRKKGKEYNSMQILADYTNLHKQIAYP